MKAHLARHMSGSHGKKKTVGRKKTKKGRKAKGKRKAKATRRRRGVAARFGLSKLSTEELSALLKAVRVETRRRISEVQKALK
jgi:hypothetical protein